VIFFYYRPPPLQKSSIRHWVELFNPDGTGFITSMNLYIHLIGEPGEFVLVFFHALFNYYSFIQVLINPDYLESSTIASIHYKKYFLLFFSKPVVEVINGKEISTTSDLMANNETELSLFQRLSKRVSYKCQILLV
jgi:hypothetical protein